MANEPYAQKQDKERIPRIIEIYEREIPENCSPTEWIKGRFARSIVEYNFAEEFEERTTNEKRKQCFEINNKEMWHWRGNFIFAPEIDVNVYQTGRFVRIYLKYNFEAEEIDLERMRNLIKLEGLERRIAKKRLEKKQKFKTIYP